MVIRRAPAPPLVGRVVDYYGFQSPTVEAVQERQGPGLGLVFIFTFEGHWSIDGVRQASFVAGPHERQVTTQHPGRSLGLQVNLSAPAARVIVGMPLCELANRTVPVEEVLDVPFLLEQLATARDLHARFQLLDTVLARRLRDADPSPEIAWAWRRLLSTRGGVPIGELAEELGWSRKRIVARFRDEIGLPPKAVARLMRFEQARELAGTIPWAEVAFECGFYDQSHLINEFRRITDRTPETFFQDTAGRAA
jgi:AraC-like DNA-binding protein